MEELLGTGTLAMSTAAVVKQLIAIVKMGIDPPRWFAPLAAVILGPLIALLTMMALGQLHGAPSVANGVLTGLMAGMTAGGMAATQDGEKHETPNKQE